MKRILITGNAGSGKTILSRIISKNTHLELFGLDVIVWKSGWIKTSDQERKEKIEDLINKDSWVIDGVSIRIMDAADTIVFLDLPTHTCIYNILKRFILNGFKTRDTLPKNCPEYIGVFKALKIVFIFKKKMRPLILKKIASSKNKKIIWIRKYEDLLEDT